MELTGFGLHKLCTTEEEKEDLRDLISVLRHLTTYTERFRSALGLIQLADSRMQSIQEQRYAVDPAQTDWNPGRRFAELRRFQEEANELTAWTSMAFHDAAMTVYHFGIVLTKFGFKGLPTILTFTDDRLISQARALFEREFPTHADVRDAIAHEGERLAVAHEGERLAVEAKREQTMYIDGYDQGAMQAAETATISLTNVMNGDTLTSTYFHRKSKTTKVASTTVNKEKLGTLQQVVTLVRQAFVPAEVEGERRYQVSIQLDRRKP